MIQGSLIHVIILSQALLKHNLDLEAALKYLKEQVQSEEPIQPPSKEVSCLSAETGVSTEDESVKKKKKIKLKAGVIAARVRKRELLT